MTSFIKNKNLQYSVSRFTQVEINDPASFAQTYLLRMYQRSAHFWDFTQPRMVIPYRRFGTNYRSNLQGGRKYVPKHRYGITDRGCGNPQKSADLTCVVAAALTRARIYQSARCQKPNTVIFICVYSYLTDWKQGNMLCKWLRIVNGIAGGSSVGIHYATGWSYGNSWSVSR